MNITKELIFIIKYSLKKIFPKLIALIKKIFFICIELYLLVALMLMVLNGLGIINLYEFIILFFVLFVCKIIVCVKD